MFFSLIFLTSYHLQDDVSEVRKSQCTLRALKEWFVEHHDREDPLIIILPDFESFSTNVLHDFILVLRYFNDNIMNESASCRCK